MERRYTKTEYKDTEYKHYCEGGSYGHNISAHIDRINGMSLIWVNNYKWCPWCASLLPTEPDDKRFNGEQ